MDKNEQNKTKSFKDLVVWQKAHQLTLNVFEHAQNLPLDHSQLPIDLLRNSSVQVTANIVSGYKKKDLSQKFSFLTLAQTALEECRYYVILATDLSLLDPMAGDELNDNINEVSYLLNSYAKSIVKRMEDETSSFGIASDPIF